MGSDADGDGIADLLADGNGNSARPSELPGAQSPLLGFIALCVWLTLLYRRHRPVMATTLVSIFLLGVLDSTSNVAQANETPTQAQNIEVLFPEFRMDYRNTRETKRPIYAGVGIGVSRLTPDTTPLDGTELHDGVQSAGQLTLGIDFNKWLSLELHAAELGSAEFSPSRSINYRILGTSALFYAGKNRHRFKRRGLSAFGRIGYGHLSNQGTVYFVQENTTHILFGFGVEYVGRRGMGVRAESIYFDADIRYSQLGVVFRFGEPPKTRPVLLVKQGRTVMPPFAMRVLPSDSVKSEKREILNTKIPDKLAGKVLPTTTGLVDDPQSVYFERNSSVLTSVAKKRLDNFLLKQQVRSTQRIQVTAHTDNRGSAQYNMELSVKRAIAVVKHLIEAGIPINRIKANASGEARPISPNATNQGRRKNRRVEFSVIE